jgi:hypothetical protein
MSMQYRHDQGSLGLNKVNEPIRTNGELAEAGQLPISEPVAPMRELSQGLCSVNRKLR